MLDLKLMLDEHLSFSFVDNLARTHVWNNNDKKRKREWMKVTHKFAINANSQLAMTPHGSLL